jgi:large subunit ribosomal protein L23Ae
MTTTKSQQIKKATKASKSSKKGVQRKKYSIRTNLRFYKPRTFQLTSKPKYERTTSALKLPAKFDKYSILVQPLNTEKANKAMTERNTLTFIVHNRANKIQIKDAFKQIFQVKPRTVNTLVRVDGKKKAFIRLRPEDEAVSIASKIGII